MTKTSKDCPFCGERILVTAIKCKHCNSFLSGSTSGFDTSSDSRIALALAEKFQVTELIGKGGMANVYKAIQKNLGRVVALKVIHQNLVHDVEFLNRFHREAQMSASLNHRNIVMIFDEGVLNGVHFMSMEYLEGMDLHRLIRERGRLTADDTRRIIAPIAEALDYASKRGLIHRDVKSANIFITSEGRPVLTDFGIAHASAGTKLTQDGSIIGTPEYMSPEQAEGKRVDGRSDIFSLGVVMYECLTGTVPFKGDNPLSTIHSLIYNNPPTVSQVNISSPRWLSSLVMSTLEKSPAKRVQNGTELARCLAEGKTYSVKLNMLGEFKSKYLNISLSTKLLASLSALLVILIILLAGFLLVDKNDNPKSGKLPPVAAVNTSQTSFNTSLITTDSVTNVNHQEFERLKELGESWLAKNDLNQARVEFNKALSLKPGDQEIINRLQTIQDQLNQTAKTAAQKQFNQIIQRADNAFQSMSLNDALSLYQQANTLVAGDTYVKSQLAEVTRLLQNLKNELNRIQDLEKSGSPADALREYTNLLTHYPGSQTIQDRMDKLAQTTKEAVIQELNTPMVQLPGGTFKMGSDQADDDQRPMHDVTINSFRMDMFEVTVKQYRIYCEVNNVNMPAPPPWGWNDTHPMVNISWKEAAAYAAFVGKRLPTEAEWEYASRGGSNNFRYSGENIAQKVAWFRENSRNPNPVGQKNANGYGLKDMSGNVWEWCSDFYDSNYYKQLEADNPQGPGNGSARVIRGGAYNSSTAEIQVRYRSSSRGAANNIGFRCVSN